MKEKYLELKKDKLCYYCYGCNKLEIAEFKGVSRCKDFVSAIVDYQEKIREELTKDGFNNRRTIKTNA